MYEKALEGLKNWGRRRTTKTIVEHLEKHDVDDPKALAVWIRRKAIGDAEFERRQREGRKIKRSKK